MADPKVWVPTPIRPARRGGLKSVATIIDTDARLAAAAGVQYTGLPCGPAFAYAAACFDSTAPTGDKDFDGFVTADSSLVMATVTAYYGVECFLNGGTIEEYAAAARAGLESMEDHFAEAYLINQALGDDTITDYTTFPTAAADLVTAVADADQYGDAHSPGLSVIYTDRATAVLGGAAFALFGDGLGDIVTINGTPVLASSDLVVPDGQTGPGVWVSGPLFIWRSAVNTVDAYDQTHNRQMAIAERVYTGLFDCLNPVFVPYTEA